MRIGLEEISKIGRGVDLEKAVEKVKDIVKDVRERGDRAVIEYTEKLDRVKVENVRIDRDTVNRLADEVKDEVRESIETAVYRVAEFNKKIVPRNEIAIIGSTVFKVRNIPISRVGIYVPRGYVSTMIMLCTIARVAGCDEIVLFTPPLENGLITPEMALIAKILKVREIYVGNGVAGIAAMAYGTESIRRVFKIFGPGNIYIQAAKYLVSASVDIDGIEGPTELVLYVDSNVPERELRCAVLDVLAELEHGVHSICVVLSNSEEVLEHFEKEYEKCRGTRELGVLYTVKVNNIEEAVRVIDDIAPEHLEVISYGEARKIVEKVRNVGVVSLNAPCTYLDYIAGPCHVLPTSGFARSRGTITPLDFMKRVVTCEGYDKDVLRAGEILARIERMIFHEESLRCREHE